MSVRRNIRRREKPALLEDDTQQQRRQIFTWQDYFFQCTSNPVSISNLVVALAAGTPLVVDRIPPELLLPVVLLSTVGLRAFNQQIVDDYVALHHRAEAVWKECNVANKLPSGESMQFLHADSANSILLDGPRGEYFVCDTPDIRYVEELYRDMLESEVDTLFKDLDKEAKILS